MRPLLLAAAAAAANLACAALGWPVAAGTVAALVALSWCGAGPGTLAAALSIVTVLVTRGSAAAALLHGAELGAVFLLATRVRSLLLAASVFWLVVSLAGARAGWPGAALARDAFVGLAGAGLADGVILALSAAPREDTERGSALWADALPRSLLLVAVPLLAGCLLLREVGVPLLGPLVLAMVAVIASGAAIVDASERISASLRGMTASLAHRAQGGRTQPVPIALPVRELHDLEAAVSEMREAVALRDVTTGLPNRKLLEDRLALAMARGPAVSEPFALLHVDLDRYRLVDSSLGREAAELLLASVAQRLESLGRNGGTVARVGDDEFALLLPGVGDQVEAETFALTLMEAIKRPFVARGGEVFLTATVGIGLFPRDGATPSTLLQNATAATNAAKQKGQDSYRRYTARVSAREVRRLFLETGLRRALDSGSLALHFQPIVDVSTGRARRTEALLRWAGPDGAFLSPAEFIPVAETSGLILAIDSWVLTAACSALAAMAKDGMDTAVSINLSARQFQAPDLTDQVRNALAAHGVAASRLGIEITEGSALQDFERSAETLRSLRALGVRVSIDDFGTGHSSLSYLSRLPVDTVKLDGSFVRDLGTRPENVAIASAVIAMSHSLGLEVVAECVETLEQLDFLAKHGCDAVQGFLASRARPHEELKALLAHPLLVARPAAAGAAVP